MRPTFYLDLDRTVFRTHQAGALFAALAERYPENTSLRDGYAMREAYYVFPGADHGDMKTYYHDLVAQLRAVGLDPAQAFRRLRSELGDGRFEYEGTQALIAALRARGTVTILTYGEDVYQRFKVSLCPSLQGVDVVTIIGSKAEYLNTHAADGDWIIDDKIIDGLNPGVRTVHIQHDVEKPADVHSLEEAMRYIEQEIPSE